MPIGNCNCQHLPLLIIAQQVSHALRNRRLSERRESKRQLIPRAATSRKQQKPTCSQRACQRLRSTKSGANGSPGALDLADVRLMW